MNNRSSTSLCRSHLAHFAVALLALSWQPLQAQSPAARPSDDDLAAIGFDFQDALNEADLEWAESLFDIQAFAMRTADLLAIPQSERPAFAQGIAESNGISSMLLQHINIIQSTFGYATFLRVHTVDDMRGPLLRYDLGEEGGFSYVLLIVENRPGRGPAIVDLFVGSNGETLSMTASAIGQLLGNPNVGLLDRLFGQDTINQESLSAFRRLGAQMRNGVPEAAYATIQAMPPELRDHRIVAGIAVQVAGMVSEQAYEEELGRLAALHADDPRTAFLLIDYHFLRGDFAAAMQGVETLEQVFGFDAVIGLLKSNISVETGDLDAAIGYARAAAEVEPFNENGQFALMNVYLAAERFADVVGTIDTLESEFGFEFDVELIESDLEFADFVESPEYAAWKAGR